MAGIAPIGSATGAQIEAEYQIKTAKLVKDAIELEGQMAQKLLSAAALPQGTGGNLNIQI